MLRRALPADLPFIFDLYMHPAVNPWLLYDPMTIEAFEPVYLELIREDVKYIFSDGVQDAGMVKLIPYKYRTAHILYVGGLAIHPDFSGRGYGRLLMQDVVAKAREDNFKRLELSVTITNGKAIQLYEQEGFVKEGILKGYSYLSRENKYMDEVLMARLL
ncbi:GNAT family N-acetyltransferase [Terrimonas sp. NA20]|uniref:GNAT family N-acetyltransferase n=1 Tax=Terrimonas ginsenosidimutans TaxID=2908004 RepID=A0ABS9KZC5_9BACT|nr:GNAT family N-acetyltransferase [Terrimonas ginsenosidimutans]MCG2617663.1 GNAT family N-acetyltransferase [Terrimonas ginsenosidimutans]